MRPRRRESFTKTVSQENAVLHSRPMQQPVGTLGWRPIEVPVDGGWLAASSGGPSAGTGRATVVLVHGITANQRWWHRLVSRLADDITWLAVDLRGRGLSADVVGPSSMARHADDLLALLDEVGVESAIVAGHSMGAFVATTLAERHPTRVAGLVLVDGGVVAPTQPIEAFIDLGATEPGLVCRISDRAVVDDSTDLLLGHGVGSAIERVVCPVELLRVAGRPGGDPPLISRDVAEALAARCPGLVITTVSGVDHQGIVVMPEGVDAVSGALVAILARTVS